MYMNESIQFICAVLPVFLVTETNALRDKIKGFG